MVLCIFGFGVAGYLTFEHYTASRTLSCPTGGGIVDCFKVTTSTYSEIHGIPVTDLGLVFFFVMALLQLPVAWRSSNRFLRAGRVLWSVVGIATALWLVYAELFRIDAICLWCSSVHVVSFLLFVVTALGTVYTSVAPETGGSPAPHAWGLS